MATSILLSNEGFRFDGRRPNELREIGCKIGVYKQADGSAYIEQGNTKVLATVFGPHEVGCSLVISRVETRFALAKTGGLSLSVHPDPTFLTKTAFQLVH